MNDHPGRGLFAALKAMAATLLAGGRTRLALLANEIEEEKRRAVHMFVMAQGLVFCAGVGSVFAVALLTALFWENRLFVLGAATVIFLALAGYFYAQLKRAAQQPDQVFAATLAELQEDLRQLKAAIGQEP